VPNSSNIRRRGGVTGKARIEVSPDVIAQRLGEQTILVHLDTNLMFDLNPTASRFWELAQSGRTRAEIEARLLDEFAVDAATLEVEVDQLLAGLQERKLITIRDADAG
jgi:Coenzyme PQQ synthesis protein D (PqqD)